MDDSSTLKRALAYLREDIPAKDISQNPVVEHPHNTVRTVPERLPGATVKALSQLQPARAVLRVFAEWGVIAAAITLSMSFFNPILYVLVVMLIGARQHALLVLGHDASHFRILPVRWQNDLFSNFFLMWPTFASVEGFRKFHGTHHQYTNLPDDGNRHIWYTHDAAGDLAPDWKYPKTKVELALVLLRRAAFLTGLFWIVRGLIGSTLIPSPPWMQAARFVFYAALVTLLTVFGLWTAFLLYWIVPFCTWHIAVQYTRLICEHSAVESDEEEYAVTRSTIPTWLERIFVLPANIGYHIEHHWYPSVPFYRLPELHEALMAREGFRKNAVIRHSVLSSLSECVRPDPVSRGLGPKGLEPSSER